MSCRGATSFLQAQAQGSENTYPHNSLELRSTWVWMAIHPYGSPSLPLELLITLEDAVLLDRKHHIQV